MTIERGNFGTTEPQQKALSVALSWTKGYFDSVPQGTPINGHGFDKTMRQAGMAAIVAKGERFPVFLPVLTAMVMDVGRATNDPRAGNFRHGEVSKEMVVDNLFPLLDILTPEDRIIVANAIEDHPKLNEYVRESDVVKIVMDADRLGCLGLLGPLRAASGRPDKPLILPWETDDQTQTIASSADDRIQTVWQDMAVRHMEWVDMLWTYTAKEIAEPRVIAYRRYLKEVQKEAGFSYSAFRRLGI